MKTYKGELIGSTIEVVGSKNQTLIGLKGKVTEETKNTLTIQGDSKKKLLKSHITIKIDGQTIEGISLQKRPEDRIKK
jgi:ribonuclease P protein subunit POP4